MRNNLKKSDVYYFNSAKRLNNMSLPQTEKSYSTNIYLFSEHIIFILNIFYFY